ncbi:transglycosylase SLT domain-containing protein [Klebsiella oxytoca]|uniref:lytic transglycosylase domain-containing protein n=1 Tax=Klebsiella oxytoca TaxID=571 RepID=UPI0007CCCAF4|nr:lytic transglycosylase domain-containing protein [Klebsiella oxytoca]MBG2596739.1 lytic transglycosylase domain-containing protein [Klebsiella oxytoca]SAQ10397.1 transglycosylase SLT domain-containing protein [Klebsiella oxytoca]SBL71690.1 transglycosylase SLT domain-containing protein [Klebsiella oxytoca]SBL84492.1 transglycosylase SLT domain-containing protein [Klebsiella oxytoca]HCF8092303.1 lytic transglycosylase domain-containing protein [Klebsiella oxytoca]
MSGAQNAAIIDELFVSLGLKTDSESFRKGQNAVGELKSGFLQLAALTGTGLGFKSITSDLAHTVQNMERLSRTTGFTVDKLRFLKHAFVTSGLNAESAEAWAQQLKNIELTIRNHSLSEVAYRSGNFIPEEYRSRYAKNPYDAMQYLIGGLNQEKDEALKQQVLGALGISSNKDFQTFFDNGLAGINKAQASWGKYGKGLPEGLNKDAEIFVERLGILQSQFGQLSETMGGRLLPVVNSFLKIISDFINEHPDATEAIAWASGVGGTAGGYLLAKKFFGKKTPAAAAKGGNGFLRSLLTNPVTVGLAAAVTPGNVFTSEDDAKAMSNPEALKRRNWERNNPGIPYPEDVQQHAQIAKRGAGGPQHAKFADLEQKYGLPSGLLNATYQKESGGGKYLFSKAGALGPFQFMPGTAKDLGLEGDDVFDLELSAEAAAKYYQMLLKRYNGDVAKAAAAYNYGLGNIDKKGLSNLPAETRDYIPSILGGLDEPDYLANYNHLRNQPPVYGNSSTGGSITIQQTNHSTIHAFGADAEEVGRIAQRQQTASLEEALAQTRTEKY